MSDALARNLELQVEWYGEPLGDRFRRLLGHTRLSQAQLATVLGLSAPMLSQLMSGHRAKISNPAVLARLLQLEALVQDPRWSALPDAVRTQRLEEVRVVERSTLTIETSSESLYAAGAAGAHSAADPVAAVQAVLRAVASATELDKAAELLDDDYPDLAEALRVLGNGRTPEARAYFTRITGGA